MNHCSDGDHESKVKESLLSASAGCLLLLVLALGVPLVLAGAFFVSLGFRSMLDQTRLNRVATSVPAVIVSSEVQHSDTTSKSSYLADIEFTYKVDGKVRNSGRVWPVEEGRSAAEMGAVVDRYPPGSEVTAFVDPSDPDFAFLEKRWSQMPFVSVSIGCLPAVFVGGLGILVSGWRRPRIAVLCGVGVSVVVIVVLMLAGDHYFHRVPENTRSWWVWLVLAGPGVMTVGILAALIKTRHLARLYREASMEP